MRHFLRTRVFAAPAPVAALALGVTVPAASRVLIPASRRAQRFTPSGAAATCPAIALAPVAARADEHLAPASGTQKQSGIVEQMSTWRRHRAHRNSRASSIAPPGEGWTIRDYRAILRLEPYASADLGAASDVTAKSVQSEAASASSSTPISLQLTSDVIVAARDAPVPWAGSIGSGGKPRHVPGGHAGTIQSRCAPIGTVSSHGLFAK